MKLQVFNLSVHKNKHTMNQAKRLLPCTGVKENSSGRKLFTQFTNHAGKLSNIYVHSKSVFFYMRGKFTSNMIALFLLSLQSHACSNRIHTLWSVRKKRPLNEELKLTLVILVLSENKTHNIDKIGKYF